WCSVQESKSRLRVPYGSFFESKGLLVRHPTRKPRLELVPQLAADIEVSRSRAAAQPLDRAAGGEIDSQLPDVHWQGPGRLVQVRDDQRSDLMRPFGDRFQVLDKRAEERHVRHDYQSGISVYSFKHAMERRGHAVVRADHRYCRAQLFQPVADVKVGCEIQSLGHDLVWPL